MDKIENHKLKFKNNVVVMKALVVLLIVVGTCWVGGCAGNLVGCEAKQTQKADANSVEVVLEKLKKQTGELKSYQSRIEYKFSQPLLESETLRKGILYYQRAGGKSALRINFQTLRQDDEEEQKYIEQYIFDGVWLTHIDYQIKEVRRYQQAEPNQPVDAFELARENFPIIGFSKTEDLRKEFEISLVDSTGSPQVEQKPPVVPAQPVIPAQAGIQNSIHLHLKVKEDSIYKDDYTSIDFWIDRRLYLPAQIAAVTTEEDIYEIKLLDAKVNEKIAKKVFEVKIPEGFGMEITPLKEKERN